MDIIGIDDIRGKSIKFHNHIIRRAKSLHLNAFCNCCPLGALGVPADHLRNASIVEGTGEGHLSNQFYFPLYKSGCLTESFQLEIETILVNDQSVILLTNKSSIASLQSVIILTT